MRFRWQNLDTDQEERPLSNGWRHGRFWWTFGRNDEREVAGSWSFFNDLSSGVYVEMDPSGDYDWTLHAGVRRLASFWLHLSGLLPTWKPDDTYAGRKLGISAHDGSIFWEVWKDPHSWSREDGWRNSSWSWRDFLQGKPVYESEVLRVHENIPVPMPEASYPCRIEMRRDTWKRKRAPFGIGNRVVFRCDVKPLPQPDGKPGFIPHPGKWGGSDGLFGLTAPARTLAEAVATTVESVLRQRERRGGRLTYVPSPADT
jgi:hypothetical protein